MAGDSEQMVGFPTKNPAPPALRLRRRSSFEVSEASNTARESIKAIVASTRTPWGEPATSRVTLKVNAPAMFAPEGLRLVALQTWALVPRCSVRPSGSKQICSGPAGTEPMRYVLEPLPY